MKLAHLRDKSSLTPQQKLDLLNQSLTLKDWNALNGRFNTAKGKSDELKKAASENPGNKAHRALVGALALDPTKSDVWQTLTHTVKGSQSTQKTDEWVSWTTMVRDWTEDEIMAHLSSGRFSQRECPDTPGVWELKDNNKVKVTKTLDRTKEMARETKDQLKPEEKEKTDEEWSLAWSAFASTNSFNDLHLFGSGKGALALGKGEGKGKGIKNKGNGDGKDPLPDEKVDKKKLGSLKSLVNRQLLVLGNKGFEATEDKVKAAAAKAKKAMEPYKEQLSNTEGWTNAQHQETLKKVTLLVESNKKEFGS